MLKSQLGEEKVEAIIEEKETLDLIKKLIEISKVKNTRSNFDFGLIEFYSLIDIHPEEIAAVVRTTKHSPLSSAFKTFSKRFEIQLREIKYEDKYNAMHILLNKKGEEHEVTREDIDTVKEYIEAEGYPQAEGIYKSVLLSHINNETDNIRKENVRQRVLKYAENKKDSI